MEISLVQVERIKRAVGDSLGLHFDGSLMLLEDLLCCRTVEFFKYPSLYYLACLCLRHLRWMKRKRSNAVVLLRTANAAPSAINTNKLSFLRNDTSIVLAVRYFVG